MSYAASGTVPVFVIEEDDTPTPPTLRSHAPPVEAESPLLNTADRVVGTIGFCGAMLACCACLLCCRNEVRETYRTHTLFGRWCPLSKESLEQANP